MMSVWRVKTSALLLIALTLPSSLYAKELLGFSAQGNERSNIYGISLSSLMLNGNGASISAFGVDFSLLRSFGLTRFIYDFSVTPTFNTSTLITVQLNGAVGYRLMGAPEAYFNVQDGSTMIVEQKRSASFQLVGDIGMTVVPIFGSYSTSTYSGPTFGLKGYLANKPYLGFIRYSSLSTGARKATALSIGVGYYFNTY